MCRLQLEKLQRSPPQPNTLKDNSGHPVPGNWLLHARNSQGFIRSCSAQRSIDGLVFIAQACTDILKLAGVLYVSDEISQVSNNKPSATMLSRMISLRTPILELLARASKISNIWDSNGTPSLSHNRPWHRAPGSFRSLRKEQHVGRCAADDWPLIACPILGSECANTNNKCSFIVSDAFSRDCCRLSTRMILRFVFAGQIA